MPEDLEPAAGSLFLVDAHVHFHRCFDLEEFLDSAADNVKVAAESRFNASAPVGVLVLTEATGSRYFQSFRSGTAESLGLKKWAIARTAETVSLLAHRRDGREASLVLVEGRQIVTSEGLEVLAIASDVEMPDHCPCDEVLRAIRDSDGLAVLPWGVGKWWFRRGGVVSRLIEQERPETFFLGDNGGRLAFSKRPALFARAEQRGIRVLPGSDPLPFPTEVARPGSYGFRLGASLDGTEPARRLRGILASPAFRPDAYGQGTGVLRFLQNQLTMQLRKRAAVRAAGPADSPPK